MSKLHIGLIVDGHSEESAIPPRINKATCKCSVLRRNINGNSATLERIAKDAASKLNALNNRGATLGFVIVDREDKTVSARVMAETLSTLILNDYNGSFFVIVADIMFENWLVADLEGIKRAHPEFFKDTVVNANYEGEHGATVLKRNWNVDKSFNKRSISAKFFKSIRLDTAKANSKSLKYLFDLFDAHGIGYY